MRMTTDATKLNPWMANMAWIEIMNRVVPRSSRATTMAARYQLMAAFEVELSRCAVDPVAVIHQERAALNYAVARYLMGVDV